MMDIINITDYEEKYSQQYSKEFSFERVLVEARRKQVLSSIQSFTHNSILEIGCGLEPLFLNIDNYKNYTIVEPSEKFVENARNLIRNDKRTQVLCGFFEELEDKLSVNDFDFIIASSLLHEVKNPDIFLDKLNQYCGENTIVHLNVPNMYSFHRLLALEMGAIENIFEKSSTEEKFQRSTRFDKEKFTQILQKHNFEIIDFGTYYIKLFTHHQMEQLLEKKIVDARMIEGLEKMIKYIPDMGCEMYANVRRRNGEIWPK